MTIVKRSTKGTALTYAEMDENIRDLYEDTDIDRVLTNGNTTTRNLITTGTITSTGFQTTGTSATLSDAKGEIRSVPQETKSTSYVLQSSDHGKHISTTAGVTLNTGIFTIGQNVTIFNNSSSVITITQGTSVTLYQVGTSNTGNRTLEQRGLATILCVDINKFVITGGGLN
jgi:hypothetical protein